MSDIEEDLDAVICDPDVVEQARTEPHEYIVRGLWTSMLSELKYVPSRGYIVYTDYKIETSGEFPDIGVCVVKRVTNPQSCVLIIECKDHQQLEPAGPGFRHHQNQLDGYLRNEDCKYGILAMGDQCRFYRFQDGVFTDDGDTYDLTDDPDTVVDLLREFRNTQEFDLDF